MFLDLNRTLRSTTLSLALGVALAGCGGGGSGENDSTVGSASATSIAPTSSDSAGTSSGIVAVAGTSVSTSTGNNSASTDTTSTTSTPVSTTDATPPATSGTSNADDGATQLASNDSATALALNAATNPITRAALSRSGVGVNVGTLDTYSPEFPAIDLMKRAGGWFGGCLASATSNCNGFSGSASAYSTLEDAKFDLDANGWPRTLPAAGDQTVKYRYLTTILSAGTAPNGTYIVRYDGSGTIAYSGVASKVASQSTAGRDVVQVTNSSSGGFFLAIKATTPGNYLRNIRVYPPGGACANDYTTFAADASACGGAKGAFVAFESFPAGKPWYPPFFHDLKGFRTLRFMDWMHANSTTLANWSDRALPTDRSWNAATGAPIETMIQLANDLGEDPWMNLSPYATDDYVHQFAKLVHAQLSSSLTLNLEYANEPWNYAFAATKWMQTQATTLWAAQATKGANVYSLETNWYARRLAQVCTIVKGEFGADAGRVRCIVNSQAAGANITKQTLDCTYAAAELGKPCGKFFDVVAIAPYFAWYISNPAFRSTVATWYADADGGLGKVFQEISGKNASGATVATPMAALSTGAPNGSLAVVKAMMVATKAVADSYGLPMWAYEGGQSMVLFPGDTDPKIYPLMLAANRDARMGAAYLQNIADWKASGGQVFSFYNHTYLPSKYGLWGLKEGLTDDANPKWQAVLSLRDGNACWWSGC